MKFTKWILASIISFFFLLIINERVEAQQWNGKITYKFVLNLDTAIKELDTVGKESTLFFNAEQSYFVYHSSVLNTDTKYGKFALPKPDPTATAKVQRAVVTMPPHTDETGEVFYSDFAQRMLLMREFIFNRALMSEEDLPVLHWKITNDSRYIGKLKCKKATCSFRGRRYDVWFCADVPISAGPWKLQGLPGLIIEAYDSSKEVQFLFQSIEIPLKVQVSIPPLSQASGKHVPYKEYRETWANQGARVAKFIQSSGANGTQTEIKSNYHPIETVFEH